jgi:hypothetical protein
VRVEVVFERKKSCKSYISSWRKAHEFQMAYSAELKKHMYLYKENHQC